MFDHEDPNLISLKSSITYHLHKVKKIKYSELQRGAVDESPDSNYFHASSNLLKTLFQIVKRW